MTPTEFEKLVVKLLLQMGYGSGIDGAGVVTQRSNDGGIDGIIKENQLGFSSIYIQAKQWNGVNLRRRFIDDKVLWHCVKCGIMI
ncbi:MAG: restriction endonuclease [Eubacteriales bacterium]|nr:restriction endonuclease [Eubacteriales bacterium]